MAKISESLNISCNMSVKIQLFCEFCVYTLYTVVTEVLDAEVEITIKLKFTLVNLLRIGIFHK